MVNYKFCADMAVAGCRRDTPWVLCTELYTRTMTNSIITKQNVNHLSHEIFFKFTKVVTNVINFGRQSFNHDLTSVVSLWCPKYPFLIFFENDVINHSISCTYLCFCIICFTFNVSTTVNHIYLHINYNMLELLLSFSVN